MTLTSSQKARRRLMVDFYHQPNVSHNHATFYIENRISIYPVRYPFFLFIYFFIHLFNHSSIHSFIHSFIHLLIYSFIHDWFYLPIYRLVCIYELVATVDSTFLARHFQKNLMDRETSYSEPFRILSSTA